MHIEVESLQKLMDWNHEWAKKVFPAHCFDPIAPLHHLKDEVKELIQSLETKDTNILEEYADCLILLMGSAIRTNYSAAEILHAAFEKMSVNEKRDWGQPDPNGVYLHKREIGRNALLSLLQERFPKCWFKPGEEFSDEYDNAIWTGEGSVIDCDGLELEAFDQEAFTGTNGVMPVMQTLLEAHGYTAEWYDGGTIFLIPCN